MLPIQTDNIYPKSEDNLECLLGFYFDKFDLSSGSAIEFLMTKRSLKLNQIEFIVKVTSLAWTDVLKKHFRPNPDLGNVLRHTTEGLTRDEDQWEFPPHGQSKQIVREFLQYLEKNAFNSRRAQLLHEIRLKPFSVLIYKER